MRKLLFLIALSTGQFTWTQHMYGSVSGGYQRILHSSQPSSYIVNTYHQISYPWFTRLEDPSFTDAISTDLSFGHLLTKNIGYELMGSYLKPLTVIDDNGYSEHQFSGRFFRMSFKLVLSVPINKFDLYSKLGVNYSIGKLYYYQRLYNKGEMALSFEESTLKYEYTDGAKLGYNLALGTSFKFNERLSVFAEIYAIYQSFEPRKGQRIEQTNDGVTQMQHADDPYFSQIQFGDESNSYYYSEDKSQPQKLYKRNYSLGGIGINLGIKFIIFTKKKEENS